MNLLAANAVSNPDTANYWCTWLSQAWFARPEDAPATESEAGRLLVQMRKRLDEDFLFGSLGLATKYFHGVRSDLIIVLDDGWDVPPVNHQAPPAFCDAWGSLVLDPERFPSFSIPNDPAESLKLLGDKIKSLGYCGLGLWVSPQIPRKNHDDHYSMAEAEDHWSVRARWCAHADIKYVKIDWGYHSGEAEYREMMTRVFRHESPQTLVEHGRCQGPLSPTSEEKADPIRIAKRLQTLRRFFACSDVFRTYDIEPAFRHVTTLHRLAEALRLGAPPLDVAPPLRGVVNIENEPYIGAALGCALGIMDHEHMLDVSPTGEENPSRSVDAFFRALRWHRLAPSYSIHGSSFDIDKTEWVDSYDFHQSSWPNLQGIHTQTAPSIICRDCLPPRVLCVDGEAPFVIASCNPSGAYSIATLPRTRVGQLNTTPLADIAARVPNAFSPIGVFGFFESLRLEFEVDISGRKVFGQDLLSDDDAVDISDTITHNADSLVLPGDLITRIGLSKKRHTKDSSGPGLVLQIS